jgi:predicted acylesterase/phospholipase RssA
MSKIFISHSSANNAAALAVAHWLKENGWDDYFLDIAPAQGLAPGERWQAALKKAADRCEVVLFIISSAWRDSRWCLAEFLLAKQLGKTIFGILIESVPLESLPKEMTAEWQLCDLVTGVEQRTFHVHEEPIVPGTDVPLAEAGLERLKIGLQKSGLDPATFPWPPDHDKTRAPYRGLKPLEPEDAAVFFGRDAAIVRGLDRIRTLREQGIEHVLVILGASGAGKSSFLRAGLWPRLKRDDRHFLPLSIIRPERAAITGSNGLVTSLETALREYKIQKTRAEIKRTVDSADSFWALLRQLQLRAAERIGPDATEPTIIIPIDQGEELFAAEGKSEADAFLSLLGMIPLLRTGENLVDVRPPHAMALIAIRSDSYERLQTEPRVQAIKQALLNLRPMSREEYKAIVEGPAARSTEGGRKLVIEPALTERLLDDAEGADALPLLGFIMERLYVEHGGDGDLKLAEYESLGGVRGAIEEATKAAFAGPTRPPLIPADEAQRNHLLRTAFIPWLAGIDLDTEKPKRRVARWDELPVATHPLLERLVEARLLIRDRRVLTGEEETTVLEIAHEALLRQWTALTIWLAKDSEDLRTVEAVKRSAIEWNSKGHGKAWLTHTGPRLESAETLEHRPDFYRLLGELGQAYLKQCRGKQKTESRRRMRQGLYIIFFTLFVVLFFSTENWGILPGHWNPGWNEPWPATEPVPETAGSWKLTELERNDGRFVALALSGAGSRAANFDAAIMLELERRGMMQQVDVISSVSAGTLPTVLYGLDRQVETFAEPALRDAFGYDFQSSWMKRRILPQNLLRTRLTFDFTSSHIFVQVIDDKLFHRMTFADLRPHPKILINGTVMNDLTRFTFTDERFASIGSNLSGYQLANAVYASMATPGVLDGLDLQQIRFVPGESLQIADGSITDKLAVQAISEYLNRNILGTTLDRLFPNGCIILAIDATAAREGTVRDSFRNALPDLMEGLLIEPRRALLREMGIPLNRQDQEMRGRLPINDAHQCNCEVRHIALRHLIYTADDSSLAERVTQIAPKFWISQEEQNDLFEAAKLLMKELDDNHLLSDDSFKTNCGLPQRGIN